MSDARTLSPNPDPSTVSHRLGQSQARMHLMKVSSVVNVSTEDEDNRHAINDAVESVSSAFSGVEH